MHPQSNRREQSFPNGQRLILWSLLHPMRSYHQNNHTTIFPVFCCPCSKCGAGLIFRIRIKTSFYCFFLSVSKMISKKLHSVLFINSIPEVRCTITKWPLTCRVHPDLKVGMSLYSTLSSSENPPWHFLCPSQGNLGWTPSRPLWKRHKMIHGDISQLKDWSLLVMRHKCIIYQDICRDDIWIVTYWFYKKHLTKQEINQ